MTDCSIGSIGCAEVHFAEIWYESLYGGKVDHVRLYEIAETIPVASDVATLAPSCSDQRSHPFTYPNRKPPPLRPIHQVLQAEQGCRVFLLGVFYTIDVRVEFELGWRPYSKLYILHNHNDIFV